MIDYSGAIKRGWKFSTNLQRLGAMILILLIAFSIAVSPLFFIYKTITLNAFNLFSLIQFFAWLFLGIVIGVLVLMYSVLLITHNYANQRTTDAKRQSSLSASARFAVSNYPRFLAVLIVSGILTFAVSLAPFIGFIFAIIAGLIFFFIYQEVAVRKSKFSQCLSNSYHIFMDNKLDTFITFIVTGIIVFVIVIIFAIPLLAISLNALAAAFTGGSFMQTFIANAGALAISAIILVIGVAFAILFTNSIKTDVYMQLTKKGKRNIL